MSELDDKFRSAEIEKTRENVRRVIMSYRNPWDILVELIQNSVDAIIDEFGFSNLSKGNITIDIDTTERTISIKDNGIGIKPESIVDIMVMGESIKRKTGKGKYGFMGYGFTFVVFQSELFKITSVHEGKKSTRTFDNLYKFVFDNEILPESREEAGEILEIENTDENSGTHIQLKFPDTFNDESLNTTLAIGFEFVKSKNLIEYVLRRNSAVGLTDNIFEGKEDYFNFIMTVDGFKYEINPGYFSTREIVIKELETNINVNNMTEYEQFIALTENLPDTNKKVARERFLIDEKYQSIEIGKVNKLEIDVYIASTSKSNLNNYVGKLIEDFVKDLDEETKNSMEGYMIEADSGFSLAIEGLPTGIMIPKFSHSSFLPFSGVVNIRNRSIRNELDSGRKGITDYRLEQIAKKVKKLLREMNFLDYRKYVVGTTHRISDRDFDSRQELQSIVDKSTCKVEELTNKYLPPQNEQETISLFIELISKGVIKGYSLKALSGRAVYDGLFTYEFSDSDDLTRDDDPLRLSKKAFETLQKTRSEDIVIEFKKELGSIIKDFRDRQKLSSHIDLIVCWDVKFDSINDYMQEIGAIVRETIPSSNFFHGVTHGIIDGSRPFELPIIELKTVIEKLGYCKEK